MRIDRIDTRPMDWGVGVLRGIRSHPTLAHLAPRDVEAAIDHIRGAARLVERLQRKIAKEPRPRQLKKISAKQVKRLKR